MAALLKFVLLVFGLSWGFWFAASLAGLGPWAFLPGTLMPAVAALWLTRREEGPQSARALGARVAAWRVNPGWYLFALAFMAVVKLAAAGVQRLFLGFWPAFGAMPIAVMLLGTLVSTPIQAGEEIGWRGFMLARLATRTGLAVASLIVGLVWAAWHLPMFYLEGGDMVGQSFPVFALAVVALSVAMAWLYARTGGSLLLVMAMHAAVNNMTGIVPSGVAGPSGGVLGWNASFIGWATIIILWLCAAVFLATMPRASSAALLTD